MGDSELLSILISFLALIVSIYVVYHMKIQIVKQNEALVLQNRLGQLSSIEFFSNSFKEILKDCDRGLVSSLENEQFAKNYWSLLSNEYYAFHYGVIPKFLFSLWIVDLLRIYKSKNGVKIREFHKNHLKVYNLVYQEMCLFFQEVYKISQMEIDEDLQHKKILALVDLEYTKVKGSL